MIPAVPFRSQGAERNGFRPRPGFAPFHLEDAEDTVPRRLGLAAARAGDAIAVVDGPTSISYRELWSRASRIAGAISADLSDLPGPVAILLPFGASHVEAIMGVLLSGRPYLPLDPRAPDAFLSAILRTACAAAILTDSGGITRLPTLDSGAAKVLDFMALESGRPLREPVHCSPSSAAVLFATSGSTGDPKLVPLSHRALLFDIGRQGNDLFLGPDDCFDLLFSFAFSASSAPLFGALLNGAQLRLLDLAAGFPDLSQWLADNRITISTMSVSTLRTLCAAAKGRFSRTAPRLLSTGGEPLLAQDLHAFRAVFPPSCVLQNAMAATETRTYAQYFAAGDESADEPVPIGWPVYGKEVSLVDGEVVIRSRHIAEGYWNDPRSAGRFVPQPDGSTVYRTGDRAIRRDDGCLMFQGRTDSLVKVRGFRVDLGAVESELLRHPSVRECAVVVRAREQLTAAVVPESHTDAAVLRASLANSLPPYMIPTRFLIMESLPRTLTGKVDRIALSRPAARLDEMFSTTRADDLHAMCRLWAEALDLPSVAPDDTFADAGGDSLRSVRLLLAVEERFQRRLPMDTLDRFPTPARMAAALPTLPPVDSSTVRLVDFAAEGSATPLVLLPGIGGNCRGIRNFALDLAQNRPVFGVEWNLREGGPHETIESLARRCVREIAARAAGRGVILCGYSLGGMIAFEIARQWSEAGARPHVVLIDMPAVNGPDWGRRPKARAALDMLLNLPTWIPATLRGASFHDLCVRAAGHVGAVLRPGRFSAGRYFGAAPVDAGGLTTARLSYDALHRYVPGPYDGAVTLLRCRIPTLWRDHVPSMGWDAVVHRRIDVRDIPGSHATCLAAECLPATTAVLRQVIEEQERGAGLLASARR